MTPAHATVLADDRLEIVLSRLAGLNDLEGIPREDCESAAFSALHECEVLAREAIELYAALRATSQTPDAKAVRRAVTDEMVTAAMRAFELMSSVLRYREKDKWHTCDIVGMRDAIAAALSAGSDQS